ncbi:MAG: choice-of-anchor B family protein [Lewinellaceae bacterium]|nr:choice-of-anchor B family protein [Lewinellaceae bacterium]
MKRITLTCFALLSFFNIHAQGQLNMSLLGRWDEDGLPMSSFVKYNDIWGYADCEGREYAIMGSARYTHFLDITNPQEPIEVSRFSGSVNSIWRDFKTYGHYAYGVADQGTDGLMVFDLGSLPDTVTQVNQLTGIFLTAHNIFIDQAQGRLYVAGSNSRGNGVIVFDLKADPSNPALLGSIPLPGGYIHDIYVRDNIAYCSHGNQGLAIYDLTDPNNLIPLGSLTSYPEQGYNHASWLTEDGSKLVFADETHGRSLKLADVSDPANITILDLFKSSLLAPSATNSIAHNPFVRGQYAIVSYYHDGVQIFDLSNPEDVQQVAYFDTYPGNQNYSGYEGCWGVYPFLPSGNIIASDITHGLFVLSADSIAFEPPPALSAGLEVTAPSALCEGDTALLSAVQQGLFSYHWYKDGALLEEEDATLTVTQSGAYTLIASNGICTDTSLAVELQFAPLPEAILADSLLLFCGDVPPSISTPSEGETYTWYLNGQALNQSAGPQLDVTESGVYQVEVSAGGCSTISNELEVILGIMPNPTYNLVYPSTLCLGSDTISLVLPEENGQFYAISSEGSPAFDTLESLIYPITANGLYHLFAFNENCSLEVSLPLEDAFHEPLIPTITVENNVLTASESSSYQWYLDGEPIFEANEQSFLALASGSYSVEVVDLNGCNAVSAPVSLMVNAVLEAGQVGMQLYPNPVEGRLFIKVPSPIREARLLSLDGRLLLVANGSQASGMEINTTALPAGEYLVQVLLQDGVFNHLIIKE